MATAFHLTAVAVAFLGGFVWGSTATWNIPTPSLDAWIVLRALIPAMAGAAAVMPANLLGAVVARAILRRGSRCCTDG